MKTIYTLKSICFILFLGISSASISQNSVSFSASDNWTGYMNVFDFSGNYQFGSGWGVADLKSILNTTDNTLTLQPNFNTYADNPGDPYWQNGAIGAKVMEASTYVEPGSTFNGVDLTFSGSVSSNTIDPSLYTAKYFIKALDPANGYADALGGSGVYDLPLSGNFSLTIPSSSLTAGLVVQYGFVVVGINANPADEATIGSVVIAEPSTVGITQSTESVFSMYPNPAKNVTQIMSNENIDKIVVRDVLGKSVMNINSLNCKSTTINLSSLNSEFYLIEVHTSNKIEVKKLMKFK